MFAKTSICFILICIRISSPSTEMKYPCHQSWNETSALRIPRKHWGHMLGLHPCWPDVAFGKNTTLSRYVFMSYNLHLVWATHLYILMYFQDLLDYCFQKHGSMTHWLQVRQCHSQIQNPRWRTYGSAKWRRLIGSSWSGVKASTCKLVRKKSTNIL